MNSKELPPEKTEELLAVLKLRFEQNMQRHQDVEWSQVNLKLKANPDKVWSLNEMELTGGEPDVVCIEQNKDEIIYYDCSPDSPKGRRSICYDKEALDKRKENKPKDSAINMASNMGIEILTEEQYRSLQQIGEFDLKTSSWVKTPVEMRKLGGAIFCDRRFNRVFTYHNGAESYYSGRSFRGFLKV